MKRKMIITTMVTALVLTGCGSSVPELSKIDNSKASEYLAGELMKYDDSYQYGLEYDHSVLHPTPVPTIAPTPVPSDASKSDKGADSSSSSQDGNSEAPALQEVSLADIFGVSGVDVKLVSSSLKDSMGEDFTYLAASKGKKFLIVYFKVKNSTGKDKKVDLASIKPEYRLLQDGASVGSLQQTITEGELQYFNTKIKAGKSKQAVLVFEVDKGLSQNNVSLAITKDGKQATVALK
ncbi:MAG: DUF4352 domain-containing protein [Lachnospiraceae bacterium]|nr:DUF4352 domain-containing protein [Lachnospiraceae bacterium]